MGPVKFQRVVSFSSEDPNQPADNLAKDGAYRKWRCKTVGEAKAWVELQLERACTISYLEIGNHGSAFIEVLVGRSGCSEADYKVLLNSSTFMAPTDCRHETNMQRVRTFRAGDMNKVTQSEKWDRVRVSCTQPFNKHIQYGISFITVHEEETTTEANPLNKNDSGAILNKRPEMDLGMFKLRDEPVYSIPQGSLFSRFKTMAKNPSPCDSPSTTPGALRAASKSLAEVALAQSEQEALEILKKSPTKLDPNRPDIKLIKTTSKPSVNKDDSTPLPSRKEVESDRLPSKKVAVVTPNSKKKEVAASSSSSHKRKLSEKSDQESKTPRRKSPEREEAKASNSSSQKRKSNAEEKDSKRVRKVKPFNKLLEGVVAVLSGYQNPLRGQLRDKIQAMGGKYKPDWGPGCTHLICAFYNTPKFVEVKGKGKIVTASWVESCHEKRKRLPWRRFCLDKADRGEESEEEIWEGEEQIVPTVQKEAKASEREVRQEEEDDYGGDTEVDEPDTEDEIEMVKKKMDQQKE